MNLFVRLRISKQDKIAANVAQHIRAVRAAEALDRRTRLRRTDSFNFSGLSSSILPVQRSTSSGEESPGGTHDKRRLVGMLKQAYAGSDVAEEEVPVAEDVACQTSYDLLEALLPSLRKRVLRSETVASSGAVSEDESCHHGRHPLFGDGCRRYSSNHVCSNPYESPMSRASRTGKAKGSRADRIEVEYKMPELGCSGEFQDYETEEVLSLKEMKRSKALQLLGKKAHYNKLQAVPACYEAATSFSTAHEGASEGSFSPTVSQDSLIEAGSSIIEESASTGSDDTPGSAVYKNIIINLGGAMPHQDRRSLFNSSQSSAGNLNIMPTISDTRTSHSQESLDETVGANGKKEVAKWPSPNGSAQCLATQTGKGLGDS